MTSISSITIIQCTAPTIRLDFGSFHRRKEASRHTFLPAEVASLGQKNTDDDDTVVRASVVDHDVHDEFFVEVCVHAQL